MQLVALYELGVRAGTYAANLDTLARRHESFKTKGLVDTPPLRIGTFGHTDVVEIMLVCELFPFYAPPTGPTLTFRRPVGAYVPRWLAQRVERLETSARCHVVGLDAVLCDECRERPLVGVHYLKLSPVLKALAPTTPVGSDLDPGTLSGRVVAALLEQGGALMEQVAAVERATTMGDESYRAPPMQVALLLGLDQVEIIAVIRATRLEQFAAFVEAMRRVPVRTVLRDQHVSGAWLGGPAFANTTSILGLELQRSDVGWRAVRHIEPNELVAHQARFLFRTRYPPGTRGMQRESLSSLVRASSAPEAAENLGETVAFGLYGPFEVAPSKHGPLTHRAFADCLEHVTGLCTKMEFPLDYVGVGESNTTIEVALGTPDVDEPASREVAVCQRALWAFKSTLLDDQNAGSWVKRWTDRVKQSRPRLPYVLTNAGINLLTTVAGCLDGDLDGFLDLVDPVERLVAMDGDSPEYVKEFLAVLEAMTTVRVRREAPTHPPTTPLAFEVYAGYTTARNAFVTYLGALANRFSVLPSPLVAEPFGSPPLLHRLGRNSVTCVSPIGIHHPLFWVHAHEIGHMHEDAELSQLHTAVTAAGYKHDLSIVAELLDSAMHEVAADIALWRALARDGEPLEETGRRFWFTGGPSFVYAALHGRQPDPGKRARTFWQRALRIFLTTIVTESAEKTLFDEVSSALEWLAEPGSPPDFEPVAERAHCRVVALFADVQEPLERLSEVALNTIDPLVNLTELIVRWALHLRTTRQTLSNDPIDGLILTRYVDYIDKLCGVIDMPSQRPWIRHVDGHATGGEPVAMSRRGGPVFDRSSAEGRRLRKQYFTETFKLLRRTEELGRSRRYTLLADLFEKALSR